MINALKYVNFFKNDPNPRIEIWIPKLNIYINNEGWIFFYDVAAYEKPSSNLKLEKIMLNKEFVLKLFDIAMFNLSFLKLQKLFLRKFTKILIDELISESFPKLKEQYFTDKLLLFELVSEIKDDLDKTFEVKILNETPINISE